MSKAGGSASASSPRAQARATATFTPYFWEAYNEIVEPRRFDHYLIRRWLPELGALGFAIVKALRDRCYHNPLTGVLRNECEVDMNELAISLGISRATLFREFERNTTLQNFVRRQRQYQMRQGKPHQTENAFQVSMDDPVHPDDYARYDDLRAQKERERNPPVNTPSGARVKPEDPPKDPSGYESQNDTHRKNDASHESQTETPETTSLPDQNATPETTSLQSQGATPIVNSPSGGVLPLGSLTPPADSPHKSPQGEEREIEGELLASLLCATWTDATRHIESQVISGPPTNDGRMRKPTFETHIKSLRPIAFDEEAGVMTLAAPSAFVREWVEKRYIPLIEEALSTTQGRKIAVNLTFVRKENDG